MAINVIDSIELPSTHECIIAKSVVKDRDDSTEPLSEEDEYPPEEAAPSEDSGVKQRFPARGTHNEPSGRAPPKAQGSSGNAKDSKQPAPTIKKTTRPPPSPNPQKYDKSKKK